MIINCQSCSRKFLVKEEDIPRAGRVVQCSYCSTQWHQMPIAAAVRITKLENVAETNEEINSDLSVDSIKASDGMTYKFLGSQWARLLPSGKTGLFAKKKISKELDQLTGRKVKSSVRKKQKKVKEIEIDNIEKIIDPSSESLINEKKLPDIYKTKSGLGFFGYIFLLIIVAFSIVGVLRTFENDLINSFPETEYIYQLLDEQLQYVSESTKNMIIIIQDLIDAY